MSSHPWELAWREGRWYEVQPAFPEVVEFAEHMKRADSHNVLDLGCGAGRHSVYLASQGFNVVGCDISLTALRKLVARSRDASLQNLLSVNSDMASLPFEDEIFDAIISTNVLHHSTTMGIGKTIAEVFRVVKGGALGFLMTLSEHDYKNGRGKKLEDGTFVMTEGDELGIVHHFFSREELLSRFERFEVVSVSEELIPIDNGTRAHFHLTFKKD